MRQEREVGTVALWPQAKACPVLFFALTCCQMLNPQKPTKRKEGWKTKRVARAWSRSRVIWATIRYSTAKLLGLSHFSKEIIITHNSSSCVVVFSLNMYVKSQLSSRDTTYSSFWIEVLKLDSFCLNENRASCFVSDCSSFFLIILANTKVSLVVYNEYKNTE